MAQTIALWLIEESEGAVILIRSSDPELFAESPVMRGTLKELAENVASRIPSDALSTFAYHALNWVSWSDVAMRMAELLRVADEYARDDDASLARTESPSPEQRARFEAEASFVL
jgi:hypothetical protein